MSLYPPPTSNVQIFNPALFTNSIQGGGLNTIGTGSYLSYPVAQGAETFIGPLNTLTLDAQGIALGVIVSSIQQGIAMNGTGFAWNNGAVLATITWQTLADRIQYANAISQPTNATTLNVNNTVRVQNGETTTSPTPYVDIIAGATTSIGLTGNRGTVGQVLTSGGSAGSLTWGSGGGGSVGTLQDVINNSPDLQAIAPTLNQVIQYNGTNPVWTTFSESQTLEEVLTSGNTASAPLTLVLQNVANSTSNTLNGTTLDVEFDDGVTSEIVSYSSDTINHSGTNTFAIVSDSAVSLSSISGSIQIQTPLEIYMNTSSPSTGDGVLYVKDVLMEGVDNSTTVHQIHSANQSSNTGYARLELSSGNVGGVVPPRVILQAFVDATLAPPYPANVNKIDLGGTNGEEILITCGNVNEGLPESQFRMYNDVNDATNNYLKLGVTDPIGGLGGELTMGNVAYSIILSNQLVQTVSGLGDIVNRRNLSFGTGYTGLQCGILEKTALNAVTSGTTTFNTANAFQTTMNTPTIAGRIFVLPAPSAGTIGYWYGICNKSTAQTIAVQYPAATTIATIAVSPSATNGGTVVRFAVDYTGTTYSRIG